MRTNEADEKKRCLMFLVAGPASNKKQNERVSGQAKAAGEGRRARGREQLGKSV